jgi:hypothetical protein
MTRTAGRTAIAVTLIDREPAYVYKPMLHAIAAGTSDFSQQETNYIALARDRHFVFHPGELQGIDRDAQRIRLGPFMLGGRSIVPERAISYDTLILATGCQANDFGTPGVQQYCHRVDCRSQALDLNRDIRTRLLESLAAGSALSIAIVGGGASGVELATQGRKGLRKRRVATLPPKIVFVEKGLKLFKDIVARNGISIRKGHTLLANLVPTGEVPLALTAYSYRVEQLIHEGAPVAIDYLPPVVALPTGGGVFRRAPHPNAALLFEDFMLTDGQAILAVRQAVPTNLRVKAPPPGLLFIDIPKFMDQQAKWTRLFQATFAAR